MASGSLVVPWEGVPLFWSGPDGAMSHYLRVFSTSSTTKATSSRLMTLLDGPPSPSLLPEHCGRVLPPVDLVAHALVAFMTFATWGPLLLACFSIPNAATKDDSNLYQQRGSVILLLSISSHLLDSFSVTQQCVARIKHMTSRD